MSDNSDFTPELTLTPDLSAGTAAAQAPQAPELTLTPDRAPPTPPRPRRPGTSRP